MQMESQVIQVNLDDIIPNRFQPRIAFDEKALNELAASIKEHGIIQPLVLRKLGKKYEIIAGERRYKAATMAGLETVPAVISNIDDNKSAEVALVENIQRKDLTAIEEARSYKNLLDKGYLTQEQLAKKMGLSQSAISNKLRLLNLDVKVQQALLENKISERHARSLLKLSNPEDQKKWLDKVIKERLTVKKLDELLKKELNAKDDEITDVPLVDSPDLDKIREQATDINENKQKNIANLLVAEDTMTEYSDNLPKDIDVPNNVISDPTVAANVNMSAPVGATPGPSMDTFNGMNNNQEVLNAVPPTSNKFFNPLEDSPATMDNLNPFAADANFTVEQAPAQNSDVEVFDVPSSPAPVDNSVETLGDNIQISYQTEPLDSLEPTPTEVAVPNGVPSAPEVANPIVNELNPNNKFFQPVQESSVSSSIADMNPAPASVNPMDNVDNLINNNPVTAANIQRASLVDAINDIRSKVEELNVKGLNVTIDEADLEASYQMNISIMK